jgi:hypothetical protein
MSLGRSRAYLILPHLLVEMFSLKRSVTGPKREYETTTLTFEIQQVVSNEDE